MKTINGIKMFSSQEVMALLGISPAVLGRMRKEGLIRSVPLGKGLYTSEESLSDYLNGYTKEQALKREISEKRQAMREESGK